MTITYNNWDDYDDNSNCNEYNVYDPHMYWHWYWITICFTGNYHQLIYIPCISGNYPVVVGRRYRDQRGGEWDYHDDDDGGEDDHDDDDGDLDDDVDVDDGDDDFRC